MGNFGLGDSSIICAWQVSSYNFDLELNYFERQKGDEKDDVSDTFFMVHLFRVDALGYFVVIKRDSRACWLSTFENVDTFARSPQIPSSRLTAVLTVGAASSRVHR